MKKSLGTIFFLFYYSLGAESISTIIIKNREAFLNGIEIIERRVNSTAYSEELKRFDTEINNLKSVIELSDQQTKAEKEMLEAMIAQIMKIYKDNKWHNLGGDGGTRCQYDTIYGNCHCITIIKKAEFDKLVAQLPVK